MYTAVAKKSCQRLQLQALTWVLDMMKSQPDRADAADMSPALITALIAAAFVLLALKSVAAEMEYSRRWHALREEARTLRERQMERLRNLRPKLR